MPPNLLSDTIEGLAQVMREATDWEVTERSSVGQPLNPRIAHYQPPPLRRYQWRSAAAGARLLYMELGDTGTVLMAVEARPDKASAPAIKNWPQPFGLVTGSAGAHPMIHARRYQYSNSDGSSCDVSLATLVTPTVVLAKFIHDTAMHGANNEH